MGIKIEKHVSRYRSHLFNKIETLGKKKRRKKRFLFEEFSPDQAFLPQLFPLYCPYTLQFQEKLRQSYPVVKRSLCHFT